MNGDCYTDFVNWLLEDEKLEEIQFEKVELKGIEFKHKVKVIGEGSIECTGEVEAVGIKIIKKEE